MSAAPSTCTDFGERRDAPGAVLTDSERLLDMNGCRPDAEERCLEVDEHPGLELEIGGLVDALVPKTATRPRADDRVLTDLEPNPVTLRARTRVAAGYT